jgi:hypothetical protein
MSKKSMAHVRSGSNADLKRGMSWVCFSLPFFKAGVHFAECADDIKEMVRGLIRYLNKAGMSPKAK